MNNWTSLHPAPHLKLE
ncbi:hypothetical protein CEXT_399801, partial [Caerostris extrusa]